MRNVVVNLNYFNIPQCFIHKHMYYDNDDAVVDGIDGDMTVIITVIP